MLYSEACITHCLFSTSAEKCWMEQWLCVYPGNCTYACVCVCQWCSVHICVHCQQYHIQWFRLETWKQRLFL